MMQSAPRVLGPNSPRPRSGRLGALPVLPGALRLLIPAMLSVAGGCVGTITPGTSSLSSGNQAVTTETGGAGTGTVTGTGATTGTLGGPPGGSSGGSGGGPGGVASGTGGGRTQAGSTGGTMAAPGASTGGIGGAPDPGALGGFVGAGSTVQGIFIPMAHPRLFWTPARLAKAKTWWTTHSFEPRNDVYSVADQLFAYMMTGNAKYCQEALSFSLAVDLSSCPSSKAGCDDARWYGETAITTYDWCYGEMTDAQRTTFRTSWNTWLNAIRAQVWGGPGQSQSNYYFGDLRNDIEWGIASYFENPGVADTFLTDGLVTRYKNDFIPATLAAGQAMGGLGLEGGQYGPYQSYYVSAVAFPSLYSSGRDIWTETPYWKGTVLNRIYMTPPQPTKTASGLRSGWDVFGFGDDEQWESGAPATDTEKGTFMMAAANRWPGSSIGQWARQWLQTVQPDIDDTLESTDLGGPARDYSSLPFDYYDAGPRYLVGRSDWTTNATAFLWQMGDAYSSGHNHDDWGAFQLHRKGRWLTRETVGYTESVPAFGGVGSQPLYTGFGHNVPLVNGLPGVMVQGMPPVGSSEGNWASSPVVHRLASQAAYAYADVDLTGVYHCCKAGATGGNTAAVHVEREYWFFRDIETTVIFDRLQSDTAARSKSFVIHCETNPAAIDATHVDCVNGDQQLAITTLVPAVPASRTIIDESKAASPPPKANAQYRVEINDAPNATLSYTLHVLQAMDTTATKLMASVVDSAPGQPASGTYTVTLDGKHALQIAKGVTSTGGSVTLGGGAPQSLRADVQGFALDASDLPVWAP